LSDHEFLHQVFVASRDQEPVAKLVDQAAARRLANSAATARIPALTGARSLRRCQKSRAGTSAGRVRALTSGSNGE
jgi:hypothetical protein